MLKLRLPDNDVVVPLACIFVIIRIGLALALPYDRLVGSFDDDSYYYFTIARNIANGAGSSFNGIDLTNGYHPLWQILLVPIFGIFEGQSALIAVTILSAAIFIASCVLLARLGRMINATIQMNIGSLPLLVTGVTGPSYWFSGMESGLLLLSLISLSLVYVQTHGFRARLSPVGSLQCGLILAIAVLARLDAIFIACLLVIIAAWRWRQPLKIITLAAPCAILVGTYLILNTALFHTPVPVSGQAKALGGVQAWNTQVFSQFLRAPVIFGLSSWLGLVALVVAPLAIAASRKDCLSRLASAEYGLVSLSCGLITICYLSLTSSWQLWPWYFYSAPLALAVALPIILTKLRLSIPLWRITVLATCGLAMMAVILETVRFANGTVTRSAFIEAGPAVADSVEMLEPSNVPLAMGDRAGSVAYHLSRPVVQLEGLVESAEYLRALRNGTVHRYLADRHVGLYARGDASPGKRTGRHCLDFEEPTQGNGPKFTIRVRDDDLLVNIPLADGTSYRVWRYRLEMNPSTSDNGFSTGGC